MNDTFRNNRRFWWLADLLCSRPLESAEIVELESYLTADAALQQPYLDFCQLHTDLNLSICAHQALLGVQALIDTATAETTPVIPLPTRSPTVGLSRWSLSSLSLATLAVALVFYGSFALVVWTMSWGRDGSFLFPFGGRQAAEAPTPVAYLVKLPTDDHPRSALQAAESVSIDSGLAKIEFVDGATVLLEGPTNFTLESTNRGHLHHGKLVARVPNQAIGFTVQTPTASVVDLGTEFGVEVTDGGTTVQVLEGSVEFASSGQQPANGNPQSPKQRLRAGQAARISATTQAIVAADFVPDKFIRPSKAQKKSTGLLSMIDLSNCIATQSSQYEKAVPELAIDNDASTTSHTAMDDTAAWLKLDLKQPRSIALVALFNRESCRGTLRDITIKILAADGQTIVAKSQKLNPKNAIAGEDDFEAGPAQLIFDIAGTLGAPAIGQFVLIERERCVVDAAKLSASQRDKFRLSLGACANSLVLNEVQVFDLPPQAIPAAPTKLER